MHVQRGQLGVDLQVVDAGFFGCFAQRGGDNAGVGLLTVPAQLQPPPESWMQRQQRVGAGVVEDERGAGDMTRHAVAKAAVGARGKERQHGVAQRVLAISPKRFDRPVLNFLSREEVQALLDAPDRGTWSGHRDAVLFTVLYNTGARVSEVTGLRIADVLLDRAAALHLHGKGRKDRVIPLWKSTAAQLRAWLELIDRSPGAPVFPNRAGNRLSRSGAEQRLQAAISKASQRCPSLAARPISPHTLRHTTAMHLLQSGLDITVIALFLGHEDPATTHMYIEADLAMKEAALQRLDPPAGKPVRFKAGDRLLAFLESL